MQLTRFTDYVLRTLLYLGAHPGEIVPVSAMSESFGISQDHLAKAAKWLTRRGYVRAHRGAAGGLQLTPAAESLRLGALVRETEPQTGVLDCFEDDPSVPCPFGPACELKRALAKALASFYAELDRYTLADLLHNAPELVQLLPSARLLRAR